MEKTNTVPVKHTLLILFLLYHFLSLFLQLYHHNHQGCRIAGKDKHSNCKAYPSDLVSTLSFSLFLQLYHHNHQGCRIVGKDKHSNCKAYSSDLLFNLSFSFFFVITVVHTPRICFLIYYFLFLFLQLYHHDLQKS